MCEANVYMWENGREELVLERVDKIVPRDGVVYLESIFGERKEIPARIKEMSLVYHKVLLEKIAK